MLSETNEARISLHLPFKTSSANWVEWSVYSIGSMEKNQLVMTYGGSKDQVKLILRSNTQESVLFSSKQGVSENFHSQCRLIYNRSGIRLLINGSLSLDTHLIVRMNYSLSAEATTSIKIKQSTASFWGKHHIDNWYAGEIVKDTSAPLLTKITRSGEEQITLSFSEEVHWDSTSRVQFPPWANLVHPSVIQHDSSITLRFNTFLKDTTYRLFVGNIRDTSGNTMTDSSLVVELVYGEVPKPGDLIFNELMIDPSPAVSLLEVEYVELYNRSKQFLRLEGIHISDDKTTVLLPLVLLRPDSFLVISKEAVTPGGYVLPKFMALNNAEEVFLLKVGQTLIDSFYFNLDSYSPSPNGGVSLERVNPIISCSFPTNWNWSSHPSGGSPNAENSLLDQQVGSEAIDIVNSVIASDSTLEVSFNRPVNWTQSPPKAYVDNRLAEFRSRTKTSGVIQSNSLSSPNREYSFELGPVQGCNRADQQHFRGNLIRPGTPKVGELLFNEIMYDPGENWSEYIELLNAGSQYIDLSQFQLQFVKGDTVHSVMSLSDDLRIIEQGHLVLITSNTNFCMEHYCPPEAVVLFGNLFPLPNAGGKILLSAVSDSTWVIDSLAYDSEMHFDWLRSTKGVSLERVGNLPIWNSSSGFYGGGTPGMENSHQPISNLEDQEVIKVLNPVVSPNSDGFQDALLIAVNSKTSNLVLEASVFDRFGERVSVVSELQTFGSSQILRWDAVSMNGDLLPSGVYFLVFQGMDDRGRSFRFTHAITLMH